MLKVDLKIRDDFDTAKVAQLVQSANKFESIMKIERDTKSINLKSIMGMISLALLEGDEISLVVDGLDEREALNELKNLL